MKPEPAVFDSKDLALIGELIVNSSALENTLAVAVGVMRKVAGDIENQVWEEVVFDIWEKILGQAPSTLANEFEKLLSRIPENTTGAAKAIYINNLILDARELLEYRNGIAHGLWEKQKDGLVCKSITRPTRRSREVPGEGRIRYTKATKEELCNHINQMEEASRDLGQIIREVWPDDWNPLPETSIKEAKENTKRRSRAEKYDLKPREGRMETSLVD